MKVWQVILYGAIGGAVPDITRIAKSGTVTQTVVVSLVALVILGAIASFAASQVEAATVIGSLAAGYAGPELLSRIFASPPSSGAAAAAGGGVREWWSR